MRLMHGDQTLTLFVELLVHLAFVFVSGLGSPHKKLKLSANTTMVISVKSRV